MFIATLFSVSLPFSTRANAERAVAHRIAKTFYGGFPTRGQFTQHLQREDYGAAVQWYNEFVLENFPGHVDYLRADITEVKIDQPF